MVITKLFSDLCDGSVNVPVYALMYIGTCVSSLGLGEKVMRDDEFTCDLFRFLQLLCEGHNSGECVQLTLPAIYWTTLQEWLKTNKKATRVRVVCRKSHWDHGTPREHSTGLADQELEQSSVVRVIMLSGDNWNDRLCSNQTGNWSTSPTVGYGAQARESCRPPVPQTKGRGTGGSVTGGCQWWSGWGTCGPTIHSISRP